LESGARLPPWFARWKNPAGLLAAGYDLEMKLIGPDGGDGLRTICVNWVRVKSSAAYCLLDKLEPYRTDLAGLARYWAELDAYRAEMTDSSATAM